MPTLTITLTQPQVDRVTSACGKAWNLLDGQDPPQPRDATENEVRIWLIDQLRGLVHGVERQEALQAVAEPTDLGAIT